MPTKEWVEKNREHLQEYKKQWRIKNKERLKEYFKQIHILKQEEHKMYKKEYYLKNKKLIRERHKQYSIEHKDELKVKAKKYRLKNKDKIKERRKKLYYKNIDKHRDVGKKYYLENKDKVRKYQKNNQDLIMNTVYKKKYGITIDDYNDRLKNQNYRCLICGIHIDELPKKLSVDHNHITKKVRGLICYKCNLGIANFNDNIDILYSAIKYLKDND
jgi:hypothetical protein